MHAANVFGRSNILKALFSARTTSSRVEPSRPVISLAASNCALLSLLVVLADSQGAQTAVAYSSTLRITAM